MRITLMVLIMLPGVIGGAAAQRIGNFEFERLDRIITLAEGGQARAVIVAPEDAPNPVLFAAEELKLHLDAMTGGDFAIVTAIPDDRLAIVLGDCPQARAAGIDVDTIARDGYAIVTVGDTIFIAGRDDATDKSGALQRLRTEPFARDAGRYEMERRFGAATWDFERGTLYGAYRFLEELGVRWFFPGEHGTVIPPTPDLSVQAFSLREEPVYILRKVGQETWQWYFLDSDRLAGLVNRDEYEELGYGGEVLRLWLLRMRGSSEWFAFNHRPPRMELEQRYGAEHPEYFALRPNGERDLAPQPGRTGHLCYTEPGVLEITKRDIDAYFAGVEAAEMGLSAHRVRLNPFNRGWPASAIYGRTVSLLPHDSFIACACEDCAPHIHEEWGEDGKYSELVWQFVVRVAEWMQEAHPDALAICLAYSYYSERPPDLTGLPENVIVGMCPANYARTSRDLDPDNYADLMRMVREWSSVNDRPMLIWLHNLYRYREPRRKGIPMLLTGLYERLFRDLAEHANLMHVEQDADSIMLEHLNRYVMLRLLYNPNLEAEEIIADYARSFYGPGAQIVSDMLADIEARGNAAAVADASSTAVWEEYFTEEVVSGYREQTNRLLEATADTRFADAADLFSRWFVGEIERGRELYVHNVKEVAESPGGRVSIRALVGEITINGVLDEEGWERSSRVSFVNNIDGEPTQFRTELRQLRAPENLYFAFTCYDPNAAALPTKEGETDSVEIFLDPQHDHDSYYWLWIDNAGRMLDWHIPGGGEPTDEDWESGAEIATRLYDDRWVVEVRLPRASMTDGLQTPDGRPWGANFCRSMRNPPQPRDQFSGWSPLLRGKFHQPDLFGHIFFVK